MPAIIGTEEAQRICQESKPPEGAMKKVLAWAEAEPNPSKVYPLLLLETNNYASRKGLDNAVHSALGKCASGDTSPLWACVERDRDKYRVLHAIRGLGSMGSPTEIARLIDLGRTRILRIHWSAILDISRASGVPVPEDVAAAQRALDGERGPTDFEADFLARPGMGVEPAAAAAAPSPRPEPKKKPAAAKQTDGWPAVFSAEGERNSYLAVYKRAREGRWTLTRMEGLFEEVDLAWFLAALGRRDEALAVVRHLSENVAPTTNMNIWTPVGYGICLEAHLLRSSGKLEESLEAIQRIIAHPFMAKMPRKAIEGILAVIPKRFADGAKDSSRKSACRSIARALDEVIYYLEMAAASRPEAAWYPVEQLEQYLVEGLARLGERLRD